VHDVFFAAQSAMLDRLRRATLADLVRRDGAAEEPGLVSPS
jgi:hypothetical protein